MRPMGEDPRKSLNGKSRWTIRLWDSPWQYLKRQLDCSNNEAFVMLPPFRPSSFFFPNTFWAPCGITADVRVKKVFPCGIAAGWIWRKEGQIGADRRLRITHVWKHWKNYQREFTIPSDLLFPLYQCRSPLRLPEKLLHTLENID